MTDSPPLLFTPRFGALHPVNSAARDAVKALAGECRVEIKRSSANERRYAVWARTRLPSTAR